MALGVDFYLLSNRSPHPFNRRALRVSMGHKIFAAEVTEDLTPLSKLKATEKWVLIMGHEGKGIS